VVVEVMSLCLTVTQYRLLNCWIDVIKLHIVDFHEKSLHISNF
jgi:hypothetical protein